jgi:hypothetical protein
MISPSCFLYFILRKTRRNSTASSSLNIQHDLQPFGLLGGGDGELGLPFGSPAYSSLSRKNSHRGNASEFEICSSPNSSMRMGGVSRTNSGISGVEAMYSLERGQSMSLLTAIEMDENAGQGQLITLAGAWVRCGCVMVIGVLWTGGYREMFLTMLLICCADLGTMGQRSDVMASLRCGSEAGESLSESETSCKKIDAEGREGYFFFANSLLSV